MSVIFAMAASWWRTVRAEFETYREHAYGAAEDATKGVLLNARGVAAGISPYSLFIGPEVRARAYASEELLEWWAKHPRLTFEAFERQRAAEFGGAA